MNEQTHRNGAGRKSLEAGAVTRGCGWRLAGVYAKSPERRDMQGILVPTHLHSAVCAHAACTCLALTDHPGKAAAAAQPPCHSPPHHPGPTMVYSESESTEAVATADIVLTSTVAVATAAAVSPPPPLLLPPALGGGTGEETGEGLGPGEEGEASGAAAEPDLDLRLRATAVHYVM